MRRSSAANNRRRRSDVSSDRRGRAAKRQASTRSRCALADRFIDRNSFSASIELRSHVFDVTVMSTALTFEAAPFIDAGQVFPRVGDSPVNRLHVAGGIGLRMMAAPFVVGYVDVGYGGEDVAVFSGIKYPF